MLHSRAHQDLAVHCMHGISFQQAFHYHNKTFLLHIPAACCGGHCQQPSLARAKYEVVILRYVGCVRCSGRQQYRRLGGGTSVLCTATSVAQYRHLHPRIVRTYVHTAAGWHQSMAGGNCTAFHAVPNKACISCVWTPDTV